MNSLVRDQAVESRARINERIDMPFSRFRALRRLAMHDMTQRDLARRLGVDAPAMSGIINDLADRGFVIRRPLETDARCKLVTITDAGLATVRAVTDDPSSAPPMFAALDDDQRARLGELLDILRAAGEREVADA